MRDDGGAYPKRIWKHGVCRVHNSHNIIYASLRIIRLEINYDKGMNYCCTHLLGHTPTALRQMREVRFKRLHIV